MENEDVQVEEQSKHMVCACGSKILKRSYHNHVISAKHRQFLVDGIVSESVVLCECGYYVKYNSKHERKHKYGMRHKTPVVADN